MEAIDGSPPGEGSDYKIAAVVSKGFLARSRSGAPALLVPLDSAPISTGRRGGGFSLNSADKVLFRYGDRVWQQPSATLTCTEPGLVDAFLVLVADIARRLDLASTVTWADVLGWVEEWQALLAQRPPMDLERQLGLWGELSVIASASQPDLLIEAWRGPEGDATDFFLDKTGLEVKASRRPHIHHVSWRQLVRPAGAHEAYLLSMYAGIDPSRGVSLAELVDGLIRRVGDAPRLLRKLAGLGYTPINQSHFGTRFILLDDPLWFHTADVPRVRDIDAGVSQVRYVVALDVEAALDKRKADALWAHFGASEPIFPTGPSGQ